MEIQESVSLACHADRTRLLEVFRSAIAKPLPASQTAVATMVDAVKPQKQTILVQDENQLLENGLRTLLEELVSAAVENNKSVMQYGRAEGGEDDDDGNGLLTRLLDIVLFLCEKGNVEGGMIFQLLEDLTEVSTIKDCKEVFGYIEGKQETLGKSELFSRGKLVMLRTCNQLLRRLSKTNDVVFCGRILMFLAHFFPLSERSAVNIKGVFNTSNETKYEKEAPGDGVAIDFTFYKTFWSLQEYFSSPTSLTHPSKWQAFSTNLSSVLEAFEVQPLGEEDESFSLDGDDDDSSFNIKYLTSSNLMSLELKDPGFRRHVLVQCLIIFDYLKTPGKAEKDGPREVIREELKVHEERVKKLLRTTPPKGKEFLASIEHILERDKNWVWWKRDGCTPFERFVQEKKSPSEPAKRKFRWRLGNRELSRLWKWSEDNPNAITDAKRAKMTPLAEYFKPLAEDLDPEAGIEDEYHHKNNKVYCWKGLRFAARQDLEALSRYSDLKIMGVVPPELLTAEVRSSLYKTSDRLRAKGLKKDEEYTPSRAQIEDATGNSTTDVSLMEVESTTPAQDTEEATAMEAEGLVVAEVEPEPEADAEAEAETETEAEPSPELVVEPAEEAETEVDVDVDVDAEADADVNVEAEADADVGAEAKPEAEAEAKPEAEGKAELVQTETKPGAEGEAEAVETEAMETEAKPGAEGIAEPGQTEALPGAEGNSEPMQTEEKVEPPSPKVVTEPPKTPKSQTRSGKKRPHPDE